MRADENRHSAVVDAWISRVAKGLPRAELAQAFEHVLMALYKRTRVTLSEVTLWAIAERVVFTAAERYASLSTLRVEESGIVFDEFRERGTPSHDSELLDAVRFVLVEFLTVVGHLTGEILTPVLHAELASITRLAASEKVEKTKSASEPPMDSEKRNGKRVR